MPRKTGAGGAPASTCWRFNEAAARCRGKHVNSRTSRLDRHSASMRPRPDAAENIRGYDHRSQRKPRFNEAAARCRGKLQRRLESNQTPVCFNEAAARCRGKLVKDNGEWVRNKASMRPRPDAAENSPLLYAFTKRSHASMRPRPDAAENGSMHRHLRPPTCASMRPRPDAAENIRGPTPS